MTKKLNPHGLSVAMLLTTAVLWSTSGYFIKLVIWHPLAIAGTRSAIALIPMFVAYGKPKRLKGPAQIGAAVCYSITILLFVTANKLTTAANAILFQYSAPVYVLILSAFILKEKVKVKDAVTVGVVLAGLVLFFFDDLDANGMLGNILALISGIALAFMIIFLRMQKDETPVGSVFWGNVFTIIVGLPFALTNGVPGSTSFYVLIYLGLFQLGLAYVLYIKALKNLTTVETIIIPIIEPLLNPLIVAVFIGEIPGVLSLIGGAAVLAGVTLNLVVKGK